MNRYMKGLRIDPFIITQEIEEFLRSKLAESGKQGFILGLSGGLDSAVVAYLLVRAVGSKKVMFLNLPDQDSKPLHIQHAMYISTTLGVKLQTQEISPILAQMGIYDLLPLKYVPGQKMKEMVIKLGKELAGPKNPTELLEDRLHPKPGSWIAKGNAYATAKHRLRMVLLYHQAGLKDLMVAGAANRTELETGTFSHWGCDHCADVMPILHLYRSQLAPLAVYLQIPADIRNKAADPDLIPSVDNKEELLGSFEITDQILWGFEHGITTEDLSKDFPMEIVTKISTLRELSRPMRETPYSLNNINEH